MAKLKEYTKYIRSKNAGPFWVTIELFFGDKAGYDRVLSSGKITPVLISELYGTDASAVRIFDMPDLLVIKISFPRPVPSGYRYERDMHFGQQYRVIAETEI